MGSENDSPAAARRGAVLFGRRRGTRLRPARAQLLRDTLPRITIEVPERGIIADPLGLFPPCARDGLWLEIGFGAGEHLQAQAAAHPHVAMIGCEPFVNGVARLLSGLSETGATDPGSSNIRIHMDDARDLVVALPEASLGRVFILFPDPWPKSRHHKRRLITGAFLDQLSRAMKDGAELRVATDHRPYLRWIMARLLTHRDFAWCEAGPKTWRNRPADWPETRYERKARAGGRACVYLRFRRRPRPNRLG